MTGTMTLSVDPDVAPSAVETGDNSDVPPPTTFNVTATSETCGGAKGAGDAKSVFTIFADVSNWRVVRGALTLDSGNATVTITSHPGMTGLNATKVSREIDGVVHGRVKLGEDKDAASGASVPPVFAAGADLVVFVDFGTDPSSGALKLRTFTVSGDVAITKGSPGAGASFFSLTGDAKLSYPCLSGDAMTSKLKFNAKNKHLDVNDAAWTWKTSRSTSPRTDQSRSPMEAARLLLRWAGANRRRRSRY